MSAPTAVQVERPPSPALRPYVSAYAGFHLEGFPPGVHLGLPGRALTLVISLGEPLDVHGVGRFEAVVGGLSSTAVAIRHQGAQHGVRISLTPLGARAILGVPSAELAHELVALDDVVGRFAEQLLERMHDAAGWDERLAVLDRSLARLVARRPEPTQSMRPEVVESWARLVARRGQVRIASMASDLGWSRRHLGERFRAELGLTPKEAARVLRFEHAAELATTTSGGWAEISAAAGYADQAHLVREWRHVTGSAPTVWRRREVLPAPGS